MQGERGRQLWQSSWDDLSVWGGTRGSGFLAQGQAYHRPGEGVLRMDTPQVPRISLVSLASHRQLRGFAYPPTPRPAGFVRSSALCFRLGSPDAEPEARECGREVGGER